MGMHKHTHFFDKGVRINADGYIPALELVVVPYINDVAARRNYIFQ